MNYKLIFRFANLALIFATIISCNKTSLPVNNNSELLKIESISPLEVKSGDEIKILGLGFGDIRGTNYVQFDNSYASDYTLWSNKEIIVRVPQGDFNGRITVYVNNTKSNEKIISINSNFTSIIETKFIPSGSFMMGNTGKFKAYDDELPVHQVNLTKSFFMGKFEVTQWQWLSVMGYNPSLFVGENLPVETIGWEDAVEFCNKLSEIDSLQKCYFKIGSDYSWEPNANGWRLPTEAEWEYACKAGTQTDFYSGELTFVKVDLDENLNKIGWYAINDHISTKPVGILQPNAFGIYDLSGNAFEWCWDFYSNYSSNAITDPVGQMLVDNPRQISRGGCWDSNADACRSSNRNYASCDSPGLCYISQGFRVVRNK